MSRTARRDRPLAQGMAPSDFGAGTWHPRAVAACRRRACIVLAVPAAARSPKAPRRSRQADAAKPEREAKPRPKPKAKTEAKPRLKPKAKPDAKAKAEAKPNAKAGQRTSRQRKSRRRKNPRPSQRRKPRTAKAAGALAPPIAAALKPVLPKDGSDARRGRSCSRRRPVSRRRCRRPPTPSSPPPRSTSRAVKRAIEMVRSRKQTDASEVKKNISDPAAKKLVEWVILRSDDSGADFARYAAFIAANPNWPSIVTLAAQGRGRRLPGAAGQRRRSRPISRSTRRCPPRAASRSPARCSRTATARTPRRWCARPGATTASRRMSKAGSSRPSASMLTSADHKARMDRRLYEKDDTEAGLRAAARLGGNEPLIAKARIAMLTKGAQQGRARCRAGRGPQRHRLQVRPHPDAAPRRQARRGGGADQDRSRSSTGATISTNGGWSAACWPASCSTTAIPRTPMPSCATPRRRTATTIAPSTSSWPAGSRCASCTIRATAYAHFAKIAESSENPISLARGAYWTGRAAEALQQARRRRSSATRRPRAIRPPITARSPAPRPGSASSRSIPSPRCPAPTATRRWRRTSCARLSCSTPSTPATWPGR